MPDATEFRSPRTAIQPVINTSQFSAGDVLAPYLAVKGLGAKRTGVIKDLLVKDNANQKASFAVLIFNAPPTGTYTTNIAFAWGSADFAKLVGKITVAASDYVSLGSSAKAVAHVQANIAVTNAEDETAVTKEASRSFYVLVVNTTETPTYGAATDLTFDFGILNDG